MTANREPGVTPDLIANLRSRVAAAPDGRPVPLRSDVLAALLDQISPEVPEAAPTYQPGDVAIATVWAGAGERTGVLIVRQTALSGHEWWLAPTLGIRLDDHQVTVTSRAVVVTEADRDELIEHAVRWLTPSAEAAIREWFAARLGGAP